MKIGLIGAGRIGMNAARRFVKAGHQVALSNSRGPETLEDEVAELGEAARAETVEGAARFGGIVFEAVPFPAALELPAEPLRGKVLISASNYFPGRDGELDLRGNTQTERVADRLPGAMVVKAFNTIYYEHLAEKGNPDAPREERRVVPLAGEDEEAKRRVAALIEEIGFAPLDLGSLAEGARWMEPGKPLFNSDLTLRQAREVVGST